MKKPCQTIFQNEIFFSENGIDYAANATILLKNARTLLSWKKWFYHQCLPAWEKCGVRRRYFAAKR